MRIISLTDCPKEEKPLSNYTVHFFVDQSRDPIVKKKLEWPQQMLLPFVAETQKLSSQTNIGIKGVNQTSNIIKREIKLRNTFCSISN